MAFSRNSAKRIRRIRSEGEIDVWFGSPEDVLLYKLLYFQLGGGVNKMHLRDMAGMMKQLHDDLDRNDITEWAAKLGAAEEWRLVQHRVDGGNP